jgi:hypothetical protein
MAETQKQVVMDPSGERAVMIFGFPVEPKRREVSVRPAEDVARRALELHLLQGVIFHHAPEEVVKWAREEGLWEYLSPREKEIFRIPVSGLSPEEIRWKQQALQSHLLTWRIEGLLALLWSLDLVESLEPPVDRCDGTVMQDVLPMPGDSLEAFIRKARLRPVEEIVQMLERHLQIYHQQAEAYEKGETLPFDLLVAYERIHAWNWVCGWVDEWDD